MAKKDDDGTEVETAENPAHMHSGDTAEGANANEQLLRREAGVQTERHRGALITALCTLAGVGMGFGLGQLVSAQNNNCVREVVVVHPKTGVQPFAVQPQIQSVTWLGVRVTNPNTNTMGALVKSVIVGSPAQSLGLTKGDTILSLDNVQITSSASLIESVVRREIGQQVQVKWLTKSGAEKEGRIALGAISPNSLRRMQYRK